MTLDGYFVAPHRSQYAATESHVTHTSGCTWTSGANGANNANGKSLDGDAVHAKVANSEETNPDLPGWSLQDLDLAMSRLAVPFGLGQGGWAGVRSARAGGLYVVLQGDSDVFGNATCSGAFDGNHAIGVHPANDGLRWWINDPICPTGRWEDESMLHKYAAKLNAGILYGVFTTKVSRAVARYTLRVAKGATIRIYTLGTGGCIKSWVNEPWTGGASSAQATKPVHRVTCKAGSGAMTTVVKSGKYQGHCIQTGAHGVTVTARVA